MGTLPNLLTLGNGKLGGNIHAWSIPAKSTCPGRTAVCEAVCYAATGRFLLGFVAKRLRANYRVSLRADFAERMAAEVRRRWVQVCRVHVAGDFYSPQYAGKWLDVFRSCPKAKFYAYTRSWRGEGFDAVLREMALLRNVRLWYSADAASGIPAVVPANVRVAWLQDGEDGPEVADLVFRVRHLRRERPRLGLPLVCPVETPLGKRQGVDCGTCGKCWR